MHDRLATICPLELHHHHQCVLLTSRSGAWTRKVPVGGFDESEALRLPSIEESSRKALAEQLSYFPLALSQAAAYITASGGFVSVYLQLLSRQPLSVLGDPGLESIYTRTNKSTWALSKARVQRGNPPR